MHFDGMDISSLDKQNLRTLRRKMQIIFQDPYASLNPRLTVGEIIGRGLDVHQIAAGREREERISELLEIVGISQHHRNKYPNEFSGGQRQRIGIARALGVNPKLIVCDEPTSALDVSIQAQIINLLKDIQEQFALTYIFISHNLAVIKHISNDVAVMYLGKIVEMAKQDDLFANPLHPYTVALLSAIPLPDPTKKRERIKLKGDAPSPINLPMGCRFVTRCPERTSICSEVEPDLINLGNAHLVACHHRK